MSRKRKLVVAALVVVVLIVAFVIYVVLGHAGDGHLTVTELKAESASHFGHSIRVGGKVVFDSVQWDSQNKIMRFSLTDGQETLDVIYRDVVPDTFEPGGELVVEGEYGTAGIFEARSLSSTTSPLCAVRH